MFKRVLLFLLGALALAFIGFGALLGIRYFEKSRNSEQSEAAEQLKRLGQEARNDPYGGITPEETLQLFIDALKKGDVDIASKYFVFDEQDKFRKILVNIKNKGNLDKMIDDLRKSKLSQRDDKAYVTLTDEKRVVISEMVMYRSEENHRWKISEL